MPISSGSFPTISRGLSGNKAYSPNENTSE